MGGRSKAGGLGWGRRERTGLSLQGDSRVTGGSREQLLGRSGRVTRWPLFGWVFPCRTSGLGLRLGATGPGSGGQLRSQPQGRQDEKEPQLSEAVEEGSARARGAAARAGAGGAGERVGSPRRSALRSGSRARQPAGRREVGRAACGSARAHARGPEREQPRPPRLPP